jgi:hypothetical protein
VSDFREVLYVGGWCVSTVALSVEHSGGMWYETYLFEAEGDEISDWCETWGVRYRTRDEAIEGHAKVCADLQAGRMTRWDDTPIEFPRVQRSVLDAPPSASGLGEQA